jgi:hypothetical protein
MTRKDAAVSQHGANVNANGFGPGGVGVGILPVIPADGPLAPDKPPGTHAATGASAASVRALTSQAIAFYFRAPVKAFFRTRVDYLAYVRAIQDQHRAMAASAAGTGVSIGTPGSPFYASTSPSSAPTHPLISTWHWLKIQLHRTTPGVLASAVRHNGWRIVPHQVLPPLLANVGVGAVLYTSYLQILGRLHPPSGRGSRRVYPPPPPLDTLAAGFLAGAIQSVVAAPLDAVQARYDLSASAAGMTGSGNPLPAKGNGIGLVNGAMATAEVGVQRPQSMWTFSYNKLREIGLRGIFAGWGLSFLKDSMGCAVFFSTFEYVKAQGYYRFVAWYYGSLSEDVVDLLSQKRPPRISSLSSALGFQSDVEGGDGSQTIIRPHYAIEPAFLMLAGTAASFAQQVIIHPLSHIQVEHWERLEMLDKKARQIRQPTSSPPTSALGSRTVNRQWRMFRAYYRAYQETWAECIAEAEAAGLSIRRWLYRGFWWNTIRQVPSTSAGLIIFELVRRKYGFGGDQVRINQDGYDIMLN